MSYPKESDEQREQRRANDRKLLEAISKSENPEWIANGACPNCAAREAEVETLTKERDELRAWVDDCQSGMFINCVYCGHRYGPAESTKPTMQQVLYDHIAVCVKHPLSAALADLAAARAAIEGLTVWPKSGNENEFRTAYEDGRRDQHTDDRERHNAEVQAARERLKGEK